MFHLNYLKMKQILSLISLVSFYFISSAQLTTINENFNSFAASTPSFPQNGWTMQVPSNPDYMVTISEDGSNKFVQGYAFFSPNTAFYLITPQIVAPDGTKTLSFDASKVTQSAFTGTIEAGLVSSPTDMASFTSLGSAITLQTTTPQTFTYNVPASSKQYIAFKFVGLVSHASTKLDNVVYTSNLSVNDPLKDASKLKFVTDHQNLTFIGKTNVNQIKIYNSAGRTVIVNKTKSNSVDISQLSTGIYFFETQNNDGSTLKSKFIKK